MKFIAIIPARFESSRLPGKPLIKIFGKPIIEYVINQAKKSGAEKVIVASDNSMILSLAEKLRCDVCITSKKHQSGTERISEVLDNYSFSDKQKIVNIQSDEPMLPPHIIQKTVKNLHKFNNNVSTIAIPILNKKDLFDFNIVKVILDFQGNAIYFSRSPIPWSNKKFFYQQKKEKNFLQHIGLYAYTAGFIRKYINWENSTLEKLESLEQLRILWYGKKIYVSIELISPYFSVNTLEDLKKIKMFFNKKLFF